MSIIFPEIKKNFGFGCMRLPMKLGKVDTKEFTKMVDTFLEEGFNYFDTAHGYLSGKSEIAIKECLVSRYSRESFVLTNKLTGEYFKTEKDIRPLFEKQLKACGVDYFDFYLMHAQNEKYFDKFMESNAYDIAKQLKEEGKVKHVGISFHDRAEVLDKILSKRPEIEIVQIQFNYVDYEDASVQSKLCYEICRKHKKPILVMEPVKGGTLINLPQEGKKIFEDLGGSPAEYAIRFAASFDGIEMVLSGMSNLEQMKDNLSFMKEFKSLNEREYNSIEKVREVFRKQNIIPCTACRYCVDGCPKNISIPDLFACLNAKKIHKDWNSNFYYGVHTQNGGKAKDCIKCGKCEGVCPQKISIRELLKIVSKEFD